MFCRDVPSFTNKRVMRRQKFYAPTTTLHTRADITRFDGSNYFYATVEDIIHSENSC